MKLLGKQVSIEEAKTIRENTMKKWDELGFLDGIDKNKINIADLYESQASNLINKKMIDKNKVKKDLYKSKAMAKISHYVSGNLYYNVELNDGIYQFPIATVEEREPIFYSVPSIQLSSDLGTTTFNYEMKGSELNRWISKAIDKNEFIKIG